MHFTVKRMSIFRELIVSDGGTSMCTGLMDGSECKALADQLRNTADDLAPIEKLELAQYDAGLLGSGGGGDVDWWQDYIRSELARAYEFYKSQVEAHE